MTDFLEKALAIVVVGVFMGVTVAAFVISFLGFEHYTGLFLALIIIIVAYLWRSTLTLTLGVFLFGLGVWEIGVWWSLALAAPQAFLIVLAFLGFSVHAFLKIQFAKFVS